MNLALIPKRNRVEERRKLEEAEDSSCSVSLRARFEVHNSEVRQIVPGKACIDFMRTQLTRQVSVEECVIKVHPCVASEFDIQLTRGNENV
jgi:hypothetical protein